MVKQKKKENQRLQIVIADVGERTHKAVKKLAEAEKRTIGKQAEWMLEQYIKEHKL